MDVSSSGWLSELDHHMEEPTFIHHHNHNHHHFDPLDDFDFQSFSSERPISWDSSHSSSSSQIISFGNSNSPPAIISPEELYENIEYVGTTMTAKAKDEVLSPKNMSYYSNNTSSSLISHKTNENYLLPNSNKEETKKVVSMIRPSFHAQDHVLAERKRREKLTQRFIALSALIPGLKKMDKASVLGDAAKYLKQLQERVKTLEEQTANRTVESVVFMKRSRLSFESDHENSSSDENFDMKSSQPVPEIEARVSDKNVLIRIHDEKRKGFAAKILSEIEKLHLTVINSSFIPFGTHTMDITVVAQMDNDYCMTVKDLVRNLKQALLK